MTRRRLPALLALLAGLLLGVGAGAQGIVASGFRATHPVTTPSSADLLVAHVGSAGTEAFVPAAPRTNNSAVVRTGHGGQSGSSLREIAVLPILALLAVALAAFLVRQRRRSRPPGWHRSTLLARGPPLLFA